MFTGIIESLGELVTVTDSQRNKELRIKADFAQELVIGQSVAHNGICLSVTAIDPPYYSVTAVTETLLKTNLSHAQVGDLVNLERCLAANGRFDGHIVQGHVDTCGEITTIDDQGGSWYFVFKFPAEFRHLIVPKGSIAINGVSLTVVAAGKDFLSVAIIPITWQKTNFHQLKVGQWVNLEFDLIGKYLARWREII